MPAPIHTLPDGYTLDYRLSVTDVQQMGTLNLLTLGLLVPFYALTVIWTHLVQGWRGAYSVEQQIPGFLLFVGVFGVLILHEWIHGLVIRWAGHRPRYGMKGVKIGFIMIPYVLFATADNAYFQRTPFILIALAPVGVITALGLLLMALLPDYIGGYIALALVINGSGAAGDLWMAYLVFRYDEAKTLVRDEEDSISVFTLE